MKRNWKKALFLLTLLVTVLGCACTTQAASYKWKKACKAYQKFLKYNVSKFVSPDYAGSGISNKESYKKTSQFAVLDMDKNGVPELISWHPVTYKTDTIYVYTYKNGKVKKVKNPAISICSQAWGWYNVSFCKKGHIHTKWNGGWMGENETVYILKSGKIRAYAKYEKDDLMNTISYKLNGKKVSSTKYNKYVKKCKASSEKFYANTKANRKKYVK